jgi:serine phosphatase RsbU (regulator of sigma subunit)
VIFHLDWQNKITVIPSNLIYSSGYKIKDQVFFINNQGEVTYISEQKIISLPFIPKRSIHSIILPYQQDKLFIVSVDEFLICHPVMTEKIADKSEFLESPPAIRRFSTPVNEYLKVNTLYCGCRIDEHIYALGTRRGGIVLINEQGQLIQIINKNRGLQDNCVLHLYADRQKNLWAALNMGISLIETNTPVTLFNEFSGLDDSLLTIIRHQDSLYLGTYNHGILRLPPYRMNPADDQHRFVQVGDDQGYCFCLYSLNSNLFAGISKSILQIENHQIVSNHHLGSIPMTMEKSKRFPNHLFVGLWPGLTVLELRPNHSPQSNNEEISIKIQEYPKYKEIPIYVRQITSDAQGNLWLRCEQFQLYHMAFQSDDITDFTFTKIDSTYGFAENSWISQVIVIDQTLFIISSLGVYQAIPETLTKNNRIGYRFEPSSRFSIKEFMPDDYIQKIYPCNLNYQYLILGSNTAGISQCQKVKLLNFDPLPLRKIQMVESSMMVEPNGVLWMPSSYNHGLFHFDPTIQKNYQLDYSCLIRRVQINNKENIFHGSYYQTNSKSGDQYYLLPADKQPEELIKSLPYEQNSIKFLYTATYYDYSPSNLFSYQLKGFDRQWSSWSKEDSAVYTNLLEGRYCFMVKVKNLYDYISNTAEFQFSIQPPWYRSYWSYLAYFLFFVLLVYSLIRLNSRRLIQSKNRLENIVNTRTAQIIQQKKEIETYAEKLQLAKDDLWGEMELAKKIQTVLLPEHLHIPGYEIAAYMKPADEVGGDYYDVICINNNDCRGGSCARPQASGQSQRADLQHPNMGNHKGLPLHHPPSTASQPSYWLSIGDVSGHGVPAGLVMMMVQTAIRSVLESHAQDSPQIILEKVNRVIYSNIRKLGEDKYMTITLMSVQPNGTLFYSGLHQDMMIYRAAEKTVELIETTGIWIGINPEISHQLTVNQLTLNPDDVLLLYTDGIVEAAASNGSMYSDAQLKDMLAKTGHLPPKDIKTAIINSLQSYSPDDDITFMIVKKLAGLS